MEGKLLQTSPTGERTFVLVFAAGDEVAQGLQAFAREQQLDAAAFTAIGALSGVKFGFYDVEAQEYVPTEVNEQVEVLSLLGNVALKEDGTPQVHAHLVIGRRDGTAMGGHLLRGHVKPTLEVTLTEQPTHLRRKFNKEFGLTLIDLGE
ncbi:hypothetical protein DEIPH_ctg079orf0014 [Deinococcus phoenicis]|uniref:PPC domain-containing protein n=1 Tax=Deinococcus phoenicis TaxID=1476583 RepID=A0A016QLJ3_9DEIO|nr:PPC domain-containing DNA-binding protein [Deinococcus phoenicis]EYB66634.1 hypothetical protein DEIPH_ctg079orf0014 [Deinococcus phoenicis]